MRSIYAQVKVHPVHNVPQITVQSNFGLPTEVGPFSLGAAGGPGCDFCTQKSRQALRGGTIPCRDGLVPVHLGVCPLGEGHVEGGLVEGELEPVGV